MKTRPAKQTQGAAESDPADLPTHWEARATNRVLEVRGEQVLERSRRIVAAACDILAEEGLEGLTIRTVLTRTGLSRRAFYERFADKDDLVVAVFEETIRRAAAYYNIQLESQGDPLGRLRFIVTSIVLGSTLEAGENEQGDRRGAAMSREHLRLAESRPADLEAALRPLFALIAEQLSQGMQAGLIRQGDPQRLATLVYNLVSTTVHTELLGQRSTRTDRVRRQQLANDLWDFCRRAVAAD